MRKHFALFALLLATVIAHGQAPADKRLAGLDTFVNKVLKDWHAAGVTIAVVEKDKVVYTGGFGFRDLEKKLPVTENTQFAIGSCTKAFTALLIGKLEAEGKLDIDKPVRNYLPELKFQNEYTNDHATLRDMMCHRTGLPRHDLSWYASWATREEFLQRIQYLEPTAELRAKWQYNNFMFMAQGVVIEKITGKSWEENMRERIFKPLGMDNSNLSVKDMEKTSDHSLAFSTHDSTVKAIPYRNIDAMGPAGSVNTSSKDMAKWLITWINNGKYQGKEILPAAYRSEAITIQMAMGGGTPDAANNPDVHISGYGLGWMISSYRGHYRVEHGGGIDGFITTTGFFPSDSIGIFVSSNQGGVTSSIRNWIADRMLKLSYRNWNKSLLEAAKKAAEAAKAIKKNAGTGNKVAGTKPSHDLKEYAGIYANPGYGKIEIKYDNGKLSSYFSGIPVKIEHFHFDQFEATADDPGETDGEPIRMSFYLNDKGAVDKMVLPLEQGVKDIEFVRESVAMDIKQDDLKKFEGQYEMEIAPGNFAKFYTKGDKLYAFIEGQPEYELVAVGKNKFEIKIAKGYSVEFEAGPNGEITSCTFVQPNGNFKAKRKN